jgi:hypothetical protein
MDVGARGPSARQDDVVAGLTAALADLPAGFRHVAGRITNDGALRVIFDVLSESDVMAWRGGDLRRQALQAIEGVDQIVELLNYQRATHVFRRCDGTWTFEALGGPDSVLRLSRIGTEVVLSEIYARAAIAEPETVE